MRWHQPLLNDRLESRTPFVEFLSKEYDGRVPSPAFLLHYITEDIELRIPYYTRKHEMVDGESIAGDHYLKIAKVVLLAGDRAYGAFYSLMNPHGQVMGFWFTTGTSLEEVQPYIQRMMKRYDKHGFEGPNFVSTDRCCSERTFWEQHLRAHALVDDVTTFLDEVDQEKRIEITLPRQPQYAKATEIINAKVGEICEFLQSQTQDARVIALDCEWVAGKSKKADTVQLGLLDGRTYVFQLSLLKRMPASLKSLLQNRLVCKTGNRVHNDVRMLKPWDVLVANVVKLGHLAKARGISPTRAPSLGFLVDALFGCHLEKVDSPRLSNWGNRNGLSEEQVRYAALDTYASIKVYEKLVTMMNPQRDGKLKNKQLTTNLAVSLFTHRFKTKVAKAYLVDGEIKDSMVKVAVQEEGSIFSPTTELVSPPREELASAEMATENAASSTSNATIGDMFKIAKSSSEASTAAPIIFFWWPRRLIRKHVDATREITVSTREVAVERNDAEDDDSIDLEWEPGARASTGTGADDDSSTGSADVQHDVPIMSKRQRRFRLRKQRVKNDILHIFLRFEKALSIEHGAYSRFMSDLRDALYVPNEDDLELVRKCLREKNMSDSDINKKLSTEFDWCLRRIRRHVPSPKILERRYLDVVNLYMDIKDAKTGKIFFNKAAQKVHKANLKHIRRNCLSDIPGVSYYIEIGHDSLGIPLLRCIRGTSALEGLHQKIRMLIRGYSNLPRYVRAILFEFLYRWNHDLEVATRNLPKEYEHFYEGSALEKEIAIMNGWGEELDVHPTINLTSSFPSTNEVFGIPEPEELVPLSCPGSSYEPGGEEDLSREDDAIRAAESGVELEAGDTANDAVEASIARATTEKPDGRGMPASASWISQYTKRQRPIARVSGAEEWAYFRANYLAHSAAAVGTMADDSTSFIDFSRFARTWNERVDLEVEQGKDSTFTYKNASLLKDAWKKHQKRNNESTTMLHQHDAQQNLRKRLQDTSTAEVRDMEFPDPQPPTNVAAPTGKNNESNAGVPFQDKSEPSQLEPLPLPAKKKQRRRKKNPDEPTTHHRCRRCGHEYNVPPWNNMHAAKTEKAATGQQRGLNYQKGRMPADLCTVPETDIAKGFPCLIGEMPRRQKQTDA